VKQPGRKPLRGAGLDVRTGHCVIKVVYLFYRGDFMTDEREAKVVVINSRLHRRMKVLAAIEGSTIQALTEEAIVKLLAEREG